MLVLVDSGILLRLLERTDPQHGIIRGAVRALRGRGDTLVTATQNAADTDIKIVVGREEFNVAGEIMVCLHPDCGGFVRGLIRGGGYIHWAPLCECPCCGQRYVIQDC